jgi:hypothetical protein
MTPAEIEAAFAGALAEAQVLCDRFARPEDPREDTQERAEAWAAAYNYMQHVQSASEHPGRADYHLGWADSWWLRLPQEIVELEKLDSQHHHFEALKRHFAELAKMEADNGN